MSCRHFLCGCLLAGVALASSSAVQSHTNAPQHRQVIATASDLFRLAEDLNSRRLTDQAEQVLELLSRDPNVDVRNEARYRRSKLLEARGRDRDAALLLRRILDEKPDAAPVRLELAQLLDRMGDKDAAWRELRAVQSAVLPPAVARLVDRYSEALRAARPWGASFELAIAPDSNISRATRSDTLGTVLGDFEIDEDSQAKSGTGLSLRGQAFRRFAISGENNLLIRAGAFADLYCEMDFNDIAVDLAAGPEFKLGRNRLNLEAGATQRWYGQEPFQRSVRIAGDLTRPLGRLAQLRINASAALVDNQTNDLQDGKLYSGQLSVERALSPTTGVGFTLGLDRQSLEDPGYSTTGWRAGLLAWREVGRATLYAQAQYGRLKADERLQLFPDKRSERFLRLSLGATFRRFTFGGFAPVSRLVLERNRSTIEFYDYKRLRTEVGITRAF